MARRDLPCGASDIPLKSGTCYSAGMSDSSLIDRAANGRALQTKLADADIASLPARGQSFSRPLLMLAAVFAIAGCAALAVDLPVSYVFLMKAGPVWDVVRRAIFKLVQPAESFANGLGVLFIVMTIFAIDVRGRRYLLRLTMAVYTSGLLANVVKMCVGRQRPKAFFDQELFAFPGGSLETFGDWFPWASLGYAGQSFPSGHTATAAALAILLAWRYKHAAWIFYLLAVLAAWQRITFGHHYLSDTLFAAAIGCVAGVIYLDPRLLGRFFDRFEATDQVTAVDGETGAPIEPSPHPRTQPKLRAEASIC